MNRVVAAAIVVALISATPHAGGWNDGSRLATVESLVDHGTWAIDDSIFLTAEPYRPLDVPNGTLDKLWVNGRFYSDKSPVPALPMAAAYWLLQQTTGLIAAENPAVFCWWMTLLTSGAAYVVAVACARRLAADGVAVAVGLATLALPYARFVSNHILLLAVTFVLLVLLERRAWRWAGAAAGLAYTIDLGAGPVIALGAGVFALTQQRPIGFALAALPFVTLHHVLNYCIGGTFAPANANPSALQWPGSPFHAGNMTGLWNHANAGVFMLYAVDMLFGKKGFVWHNLIFLLLAFKTRGAYAPRSPLTILCVAWCAGVWLLYAATSRNLSGACCSIRWFVPLIAPLTYLLAQYLKRRPEHERDLFVLGGWGGVMMALAWWQGPFALKMVPGYWFLVAGALAHWSLDRYTQATGSRSRSLAVDATPGHRSASIAANISTPHRSVA